MSQAETLPMQNEEAAKVTTPEASNENTKKPILALADVPTLATTEKLLADHIGKLLPKELHPQDLHLNLSVHLHDGKENLNFTFTTHNGFGLNATAFSEQVKKIISEIPAFASRLKSESDEKPIATLTQCETPKDNPNALRIALKLDHPQLITIAQELHGIKTAEAAHNVNACANGKCTHDHSKDEPTKIEKSQGEEKTLPIQPSTATTQPVIETAKPVHTPPKAANENDVPAAVVNAPVASAERLAEPTKAISA